MRIERFQIQGFKSIADVTVEGLSEINVFFGLNDVGKSNLFQALELGCWLLPNLQGSVAISDEKMEQKFGPLFFRLQGNHEIHIRIEFVLETGMRLATRIEIGPEDTGFYPAEIMTEKLTSPHGPLSPTEKSAIESFQLHVIDATRRLQIEQRSKDVRLAPVNAQNLKQALFYAYLSADLQQKQRLNAIKRVLAEPPYRFGELDIALDPHSDRIEVGFIRPDGRLPIENLGSGAQQLILVLGQIFLNDYPIIAVEEPEMNLSPQHQEHLMATLRRLMQDPAVRLQQLFIATHSPYLEFTENFYDVIFDPEKGTQVNRATLADYTQHFAVTPVGPDTGARLNSLSQVKLYDGVIRDLGLQRGDLVIFVRNDDGRWEIRPAREIADELQAITNGHVTQ